MSDFPGQVIEFLHLRVVHDVAASRAFYTDVLGATVLRESPGVLAFLDLAGARLVLSSAGGPTEDKPTVTFAPPTDPDQVSAELILRVADARATYERVSNVTTAPCTVPAASRTPQSDNRSRVSACRIASRTAASSPSGIDVRSSSRSRECAWPTRARPDQHLGQGERADGEFFVSGVDQESRRPGVLTVGRLEVRDEDPRVEE